MTQFATLDAAPRLETGRAAECRVKAGKAVRVASGTERFGARLAMIRQQRGLSQEALAARVHVSRRVIAYYEAESTQPPGALITALARTLKVSADELLGLTPMSEKASPKTARLLNRLRRVEELPPADQRAVLKIVDAMLDTRNRVHQARPRTKEGTR